MKVIITNSPEETIDIAAKISKDFRPGTFVGLAGELGTGKTLFTKGIAKALGVRDYRYVNSPSFVIIKEYKGKWPLYHFDVYRLKSNANLANLGYEEYFYGKGVTVVEWADKIKELLPDERYDVELVHLGGAKRKIKINKIG